MTTLDPNRDDVPEAMLRRAFERSANSSGCPDADLLGAFVDGALTPAERTAVESHASDCARCQAVLSAVVRTAPLAERSQNWWSWSTMRWLAPVTAAAFATVIWVAVDRTSRAPAPAAVSVGGSPAVGSPESARIRPQTPPPPAAKDQQEPAYGMARSAPADSRSVDLPTIPPAGGPPVEPRRKELDVAMAPPEEKAGAVSAGRPDLPGQIAVPSPPAAEVAADATGRPSPSPQAPATPLRGEVSAAPQAAARGLAAESPAARNTFAKALPAISSSVPGVVWQIDPAGTISRSTDAGATWTQLATGTANQLLAGAAPSRDVCWAAGEGGTVVRTTDGQSFRVVTFPEAVTLTHVTASDADTASVTTADGRVYGTSDGGRTWRVR